MPILNSDFGAPDHTPGSAQHWTLRASVSAQRIAGFGPVALKPMESFESWSKYLEDLDDLNPVRALFAGAGFEGFEQGFENENYLLKLSGGVLSATQLEAFEQGWTVANYLDNFQAMRKRQARFGQLSHEGFEETHFSEFSQVQSLPAVFVRINAEAFSGQWDRAQTL